MFRSLTVWLFVCLPVIMMNEFKTSLMLGALHSTGIFIKILENLEIPVS